MKDLNDIHHRSGIVKYLTGILSEYLTDTRLPDAAERLDAAITLADIIEVEAQKLDAEIGALFEKEEAA